MSATSLAAPKQSVKLPLRDLEQPDDEARLRPIQDNKVLDLANSMEKIGLITPISVRPAKLIKGYSEVDGWKIIAGCHRHEAAFKLGWMEIDCFVLDCSETEGRLWSISENLHRAELTVLERSEHLDEWRKLTLEKDAQVAHPGGKQPTDRGHSKTAKEFGTTRRDVERAETIASIATETKAAARAAGLADNQSALLKAAKEPTAEAQVAVLEQIAEYGSVAAAERHTDLQHGNKLRRSPSQVKLDRLDDVMTTIKGQSSGIDSWTEIPPLPKDKALKYIAVLTELAKSVKSLRARIKAAAAP